MRENVNVETDPNLAAMIQSRLKDYQRQDPSEERRKLTELWKKHHPQAVAEPSSWLHPLASVFQSKQPANRRYDPLHPCEPDEQWTNDIYFVNVRYYANDPVFRSDGGMVQIGISALDGTARHDWRDFQAIKNQLAGPECEALELYPAESRLLDPSNYYTLWCFPGLRRLKIGMEERRVYDADEAFAPQRAFRK